METLPFERQSSFVSLRSHYRAEPIVLYVGAGISKSSDPRYGLPQWVNLLEKLGEQISGVPSSQLPAHPWAVADRILELCVDYLKRMGWEGTNPEEEAEHRLQAALWDMVRSPQNCVTQGKQHPFKLLNKTYLQSALTLRAIAAFCARPIGKSHGTSTYRFGANPRVRAVLSGNYDPYLESAATSMYKIPVVKPVAAFGSLAGNLREIPVHHVHGYVPHPGQPLGDEHQPLLKQLVLTRKSYQSAWRAKDAFCSTMISQIYLLRHYVTLFVGFSFTDPKITELLRRVWQEYPVVKRKERWNYAIMHVREVPPGRVAELEAMGVRPILVTDYQQIPEVLGSLYTAGLEADHPSGKMTVPFYSGRVQTSKTHLIACTKIWDMLFTSYFSHPGVLSKPSNLAPANGHSSRQR